MTHQYELREDPVARLVCDTTAEECVDWLVKYKGLPETQRQNVEGNLRDVFKFHRLQGRLDRNTTAGLIAELLLMRRHVKTLEKRVLCEDSAEQASTARQGR